MAATGLAEFHSHTAAHRPCDELTDEELAGSLERARSALQMELGCASDWLCWPYGRYSTAAVRRAVASGYRYLVTTEPGMVTVATSPLAIPRLAVTEESIADFVSGCRLSAAAMQEGASP
jgi:peptidoglycan/xylan/chitin deacetylase (PgdA/CDA1 family)